MTFDDTMLHINIYIKSYHVINIKIKMLKKLIYYLNFQAVGFFHKTKEKHTFHIMRAFNVCFVWLQC